MWSTAAEAAEAADERPRALMMAAPRCCTVGMKSFSYQAWSTSDSAFLPPTVVLCRSGYWVELWLPQMMTFSMSLPCTPVLLASWLTARLWSRRTIAWNCFLSRPLAAVAAISELVLAGLPTTSTRTSFEALPAMALPCGPKMPPLAVSRSLRSMPGPRGRAPTRKA